MDCVCGCVFAARGVCLSVHTIHACVLFSKHTLYILYTFNFNLNLHLYNIILLYFFLSDMNETFKKKTRIGSNNTCDTELDKRLRKCMDGHACTDP